MPHEGDVSFSALSNKKTKGRGEPTGNLDSKTVGKIINLLLELNQNRQTIVMITQEKTIAQRTKREVRMIDGEIVNGHRLRAN